MRIIYKRSVAQIERIVSAAVSRPNTTR